MKLRRFWLLLAALLVILAAAAVVLWGRFRSGGNDQFFPDTAWAVYWDNNARALDNCNLVLFSCYFNEDGSIYVPPALEKRSPSPVSAGHQIYLSFTNDVQHADGSATQKSPELLQWLFESEQRMRSTLEDMVKLSLQWSCQGIELDFEKLGKDMQLWEGMVQFIQLARQLTQDQGMLLRVVLPCNAPVEELTLPEDISYSVMCYNLYGPHSGPGAKADKDFLTQVAQRFSGIPNIHFALANGGFVWDSSGKTVQSVTAAEAHARAQKFHASVRRDKSSGACYYTYRSQGERFTVWYGDTNTLAYWQEVLGAALGREAIVDLWRLE